LRRGDEADFAALEPAILALVVSMLDIPEEICGLWGNELVEERT
jgi:hypothetical protein